MPRRLITAKAFGAVAGALLLSISLVFHEPARAASDDGDKAAGERLEDVREALDTELRESEDLRSRSKALARELAALRRKLVDSAARVQRHERELADITEQLHGLEVRERRAVERLDEQREQFAGVLAALQRLARHPPEALIAQPTPPADTVRSAILLRGTVPEIERRAEALRGNLEELARAREALAARRKALARVTDELTAEGDRLETMMARKRELKQETDAEREAAARRIRKLTDEANNLQELMARLEEEREWRERQQEAATAAAAARAAKEAGAAETTTAAPDAAEPAKADAAMQQAALSMEPPAGFEDKPIDGFRGRLPFPAVGDVVARYGEKTDAGFSRKGIDIATRAGARVVAPFEGKVVFVGHFRGYGQLLIIEHREGYHTLLAGMARIDSAMGQWVLIGEPVGIMGHPETGNPVLYVELRRNGRPINPLPWLVAERANTQG